MSLFKHRRTPYQPGTKPDFFLSWQNLNGRSLVHPSQPLDGTRSPFPSSSPSYLRHPLCSVTGLAAFRVPYFSPWTSKGRMGENVVKLTTRSGRALHSRQRLLRLLPDTAFHRQPLSLCDTAPVLVIVNPYEDATWPPEDCLRIGPI
jgi:hypothetical protein